MFENKKKLNQLIIDKFTELSIEVRECFDSVYGRINSTHEDVDSIKNHLGSMELKNDYNKTIIINSINNIYETLSDEIRHTDRVPLMIYEDISKLQKDSTKEFSEINKKLSQISWLGDRIKEVLDAICDVKEYLDDLEVADDTVHTEKITKLETENKSLIDEINNLKTEIRKYKSENEKLVKKNDELMANLKSLDDSFALVTQGIYNQDNIEFAAVKTYREGWKYLCYNGRQLTNFDGISQINLNWDSCEKYLNMDISFTGEN